MAQTFIVPKITNGPATAATFNAPLEYIQDALNEIQSDAMSTQQAVLQYEVPVASNVVAGDLVYYNKTAGNFQKAFIDTYTYQGQLMEADSCRVEGLVLSVNATEGSAVMIRNGYYVDGAVLGAIGVGASAGTYYLSSTAGKATLTPGWEVRIPVISYYGDSKFSMINTAFAHVGNPDVPVRHIVSNTLDVSNSGDTVRIQQKEYTSDDPEPSAYAISGIDNGQLKLTPVASMLLGGAGIKVSYRGNGIWNISQDSLIDKPLTATDFTLNGVQRVADTLLTYSVFPAGSSATMTMVMPINFVASSAFTGNIKVWLTTRGPGAGTYSVQVYWLPYGTVSTSPSPFGSTTVSTSNTSTTQLTYVQSADIAAPTISTSGVLVAKITSSSPSYDMYVHQAGFKLSLENESDSQSSTVTRDEIMAVLQEVFSWNPNYSE